jgi:hypothetical protein
MQDPLSSRALPYRPSFGERRLNSDLARFSLDLNLVGAGPQKTAHSGPYPSPPMSESPRTSGYPSLSSAGHPEASDSGREGNSRRQEWDQRQLPRRSIAEAVSAPPQFPSHHPEAHPTAQGQLPVSMPAQRSPFVAQAAFPPTRAPKRPKAHVLSACVNCKKAHLSCDGTCLFIWSLFRFRPLLVTPSLNQRQFVSFNPFSLPNSRYQLFQVL